MSKAVEKIKPLVEIWRELNESLQQHEEIIKQTKEKIRDVEESVLPSIFLEEGLETVKMDGGEILKFSTEIYCSIPKEAKQKAFAWLAGHGGEHIVKTEVSATFGAGEEELAKAMKLNEQMSKVKGANVSMTQNVHPQTLKAFIKECLEKKKKFPQKLFPIQTVDHVSIKLPKE